MAVLAKSPARRPPDAFSFAASLRNLKSLLSAKQQNESTDSRSTVAVLSGLQTVASLRGTDDTRPRGGDIHWYELPEGPETNLPVTTVRGMTPPTAGVSLSQPITASPVEAGPVAAAGGVDRIAPTTSLPPQKHRAPSWGTDAFAATMPPTPFLNTLAPPSLLPEARQSPVGPFYWPIEARPARSEEPHVHTVPPNGRRIRTSFVAMLATSMVIASVAAGVVVRQRAVGANGFSRSTSNAGIAASSSVPTDVGMAPATPSIPATAATGISTTTTVASPPLAPEGKARPSPTSHLAGGKGFAKPSSALDRPGPGF
jgi:hypothetical protein